MLIRCIVFYVEFIKKIVMIKNLNHKTKFLEINLPYVLYF
jgi:hypothetical protein